MSGFSLMPKTNLPETERPLTGDEVTYLEREAVLYRRWKRFWTIAAFPATPIGVVAVAGALYVVVFGEYLGVNVVQAFIVGMVVSIFGFSPLYLRISMRDRLRDITRILDTFPRET